MTGAGFCLPLRRCDAQTALELGREAARIGYESVWVSELASYDAIALAAALLTSTEQVGVGTAIVPFASRSPALLAMGAATLAALGGSRAILGLGVSTPTVVAGWHERPWAPPLRQTAGGMDALERALRNDPGTAGGFRLEVAPEPPPTVYLAALGPRMLRLAAQRGTGVLLNLVPRSGLAEIAGEVADAAGTPKPMALPVRTCVTDDPTVEAAARQRLRRELASYLRVEAYATAYRHRGHGDVVERVAATGDLAGAVACVPPELVDDVGVIGTDAECAARCRAMRAAGVTPLIVPIADPGDTGEVARVMRAAARWQ